MSSAPPDVNPRASNERLASLASRSFDDDGGPAGRIAFVLASVDGGHASASALAWSSFLADAGHQIEVIVIRDGASGAALPAGVTLRSLGGRGSFGTKQLRLSALVDAHGYDVVVAVGTAANLVAIAATRRSTQHPALVLVEQDLLSLGLEGASPALRRRTRLAQRNYRHADVVVAPSHAIAAEIAAAFGVPPSRSLVVPSPALATSWQDAGGAEEKARSARVSRAPGTANGVQLALLSPLVREQNPWLIVDTARALTRRGLSVDIVALADGPLRDELATLAGSAGIRFTTSADADDPFAGLAANAVALLPSRREGLGGELVQAASRGVPSVALSTALGVADAVIPGVTGELAFDDDPESVADAVVRAAELTVEDVGAWLDRFSYRGSGELFADAIEYAIARRASV